MIELENDNDLAYSLDDAMEVKKKHQKIKKERKKRSEYPAEFSDVLKSYYTNKRKKKKEKMR